MEVMYVFIASFTIVFLLGFQQLNVTARRYGLAFITSIGIGISNYALFKMLPGEADWLQLMGYLLGGGLGITTSMLIHDYFFPDE